RKEPAHPVARRNPRGTRGDRRSGDESSGRELRRGVGRRLAPFEPGGFQRSLGLLTASEWGKWIIEWCRAEIEPIRLANNARPTRSNDQLQTFEALPFARPPSRLV